MMIDFHSHILPNMDDGSKSVSESIQMMKTSFAMGIDTMVSTSHYYANCDTIDSFLTRRNKELQIVLRELEGIGDVPQIIMSAEVTYFSGMSREKEISRLCIDKTKYMLIEMPFLEWSSLTINEIKSLISNRGITPIIAHIDRHLSQQKTGKIDELLSLGVVLQTNADALFDVARRRTALKMISMKEIQLLGSDCHSTSYRSPNLDRAYKIIAKKLGNSTLKNIDIYGRKILNDNWI